MPTFYNFTENGVVYNFDNVFVPADFFRDGNLWIWGSDGNGQLGNASTINTSTPVTTFIGGANWKQVDVGTSNVAAIKTDGTLWLWGGGGSGTLGNASVPFTCSTPVTTFLGGTNWAKVCTNGDSVAAIKTDGTLWTWGYNSTGQLGNGSTINTSTPITTFLGGTNWKQAYIFGSVTSYSVAAIKTDGTLWTWGLGSSGQLGNATTLNRSTPVTTFLGGNNWAKVAGGTTSAAAIKTDGTLWTWGLGSSGQLGNATTLNRSTPVTTFLGGTNWKDVAAGNACAFGIKTDGTLWAWGSGSGGRLGNNQATLRSTPVTTFSGGNNWKSVSSSNGVNATAVKTNGTLWTWGSGSSGELGNAASTSANTPITTFLGGTNWKQSDAGFSNMIAVTYIDYSQTT